MRPNSRSRNEGGRPLQRILHPTDLEAGSRAALLAAVAIARQLGAELEVFHVETPKRTRMTGLRPGANGTRKVCDLVEPARLRTDVPIVASSVPGLVPSAMILERAAKSEVDLIVMGATRLHRGFSRLLGSVAREVVDGSDRPVLTFRNDGSPTPGAFRRVLVPVDFSAASQEALALAAEIAGRAQGEIVLLHVIPERTGGGPSVRRAVRRWRARAQAAAELRGLADSLGPDVRTTTRVEAGSPVDEILRVATELAVDLVVVASHATRGRRLASGSVAGEVQRFADVPVLWMHPDEPAAASDFAPALVLRAQPAGMAVAGGMAS